MGAAAVEAATAEAMRCQILEAAIMLTSDPHILLRTNRRRPHIAQSTFVAHRVDENDLVAAECVDLNSQSKGLHVGGHLERERIDVHL